jgi:hypothetical protein
MTYSCPQPIFIDVAASPSLREGETFGGGKQCRKFDTHLVSERGKQDRDEVDPMSSFYPAHAHGAADSCISYRLSYDSRTLFHRENYT